MYPGSGAANCSNCKQDWLSDKECWAESKKTAHKAAFIPHLDNAKWKLGTGDQNRKYDRPLKYTYTVFQALIDVIWTGRLVTDAICAFS